VIEPLTQALDKITSDTIPPTLPANEDEGAREDWRDLAFRLQHDIGVLLHGLKGVRNHMRQVYAVLEEKDQIMVALQAAIENVERDREQCANELRHVYGKHDAMSAQFEEMKAQLASGHAELIATKDTVDTLQGQLAAGVDARSSLHNA